MNVMLTYIKQLEHILLIDTKINMTNWKLISQLLSMKFIFRVNVLPDAMQNTNC